MPWGRPRRAAAARGAHQTHLGGTAPGTPDELPILGPVAGLDGYVNATGGFRTGIVASPLTGRVVAQWISGESLSYPCETFVMDRFAATPTPSKRPAVTSAV